jgi:hypothetical protein
LYRLPPKITPQLLHSTEAVSKSATAFIFVCLNIGICFGSAANIDKAGCQANAALLVSTKCRIIRLIAFESFFVDNGFSEL